MGTCIDISRQNTQSNYKFIIGIKLYHLCQKYTKLKTSLRL
jgi:hypothetical protein